VSRHLNELLLKLLNMLGWQNTLRSRLMPGFHHSVAVLPFCRCNGNGNGVRKRQRLTGTAKRQRKNGNGMVETGHDSRLHLSVFSL